MKGVLGHAQGDAWPPAGGSSNGGNEGGLSF